MRRTTIENNKAAGTTWPPATVEYKGETWSIERIYSEAGYEVTVNRGDADLPVPASGPAFDYVHTMIVPRILYFFGAGVSEPLGIMYDFRSRELCAHHTSAIPASSDAPEHSRSRAWQSTGN